MKKIYKYTLTVADVSNIELPKGHKILSVQNQNEQITMWAEVDTTQDVIMETFIVYGTGHAIIDDFAQTYIGTVQMNNGLVWHVYKVD